MSLRHLILALVQSRPSTGYEIAQEFSAVAGYFWKASHQQVYRELAAMIEADLVSFVAVSQAARPDKKVYSITPKGLTAFREWFAESLALPRTSDPLMVKIYTGELGGLDELASQLRRSQQQHQAVLADLEAVEREHYSVPLEAMPRWQRLIYMTLRHGLARERTMLNWLEDCLQELAELGDEQEGGMAER